MANIINASSAYVAVGGGVTPVEIYNAQNQWNMYSNGNPTILWQFTDSSHIRIITANLTSDSSQFNLPSNYILSNDVSYANCIGFAGNNYLTLRAMGKNGGYDFTISVNKTS